MDIIPNTRYIIVLITNINIPYTTPKLLFSKSVIRIKNNNILTNVRLNIYIITEYAKPTVLYIAEITKTTICMTTLLHTINTIKKYNTPITNI